MLRDLFPTVKLFLMLVSRDSHRESLEAPEILVPHRSAEVLFRS